MTGHISETFQLFIAVGKIFNNNPADDIVADPTDIGPQGPGGFNFEIDVASLNGIIADGTVDFIFDFTAAQSEGSGSVHWYEDPTVTLTFNTTSVPVPPSILLFAFGALLLGTQRIIKQPA